MIEEEDKLGMFGDAVPPIFENARKLRFNTTPAESILWDRLKNGQLNGIKFRRQHPFGRYILDFYCHQAKLCIELDGSIHQDPDQKNHDQERERDLQQEGLKIIRFQNEEIYSSIEDVLMQIKSKLV